MLTIPQLSDIMPRANAPIWTPHLLYVFGRFEINSPARIAAFLAQAAHESAELTRLTENLNYSAASLMKTWPKRFPTRAIADQCARQPEKIANVVYANRMENGPPESGDGWEYRGRGIFQLTGKGNYRDAAQAIGIDFLSMPGRLEEPDMAARSAGWFWKSRGLNALADCAPGEDDIDDIADFVRMTQIINGGRTGLAERVEYWKKAKEVLKA